ncbi:MAG: 2-amino-4-hydroxy-6-hydroxymethyldihydropteridine diphosphokinase [Opitutales bacterium]
MPLVYLALGSNLGDRLANMRAALAHLGRCHAIRLLRASPVYENRAIGMGQADDFLNAVAELETSLEPEKLLDLCLEVERQLGRERRGGWAPRTIDLDLIDYEGVACQTQRLNLPHPRLAERDFVAVPLCDLAPELLVAGVSVIDIVRQLDARGLRLTPFVLMPEESTEAVHSL